MPCSGARPPLAEPPPASPLPCRPARLPLAPPAPSPPFPATGIRPAPALPRGAHGPAPRNREAARLARDRGPGPKGAETPQAWGSGRHEAGLARPPGPRRRRGRLRPLESPRPPVGRHSLGHGGDGGPGESEEWRREQDARRGRPRLRPAAAGLPGPRPRPAGAGQSEARGWSRADTPLVLPDACYTTRGRRARPLPGGPTQESAEHIDDIAPALARARGRARAGRRGRGRLCPACQAPRRKDHGAGWVALSGCQAHERPSSEGPSLLPPRAALRCGAQVTCRSAPGRDRGLLI